MAIKKIRLGKAKEGVNVTALREIKLLKELHGPHVIQLLDVFPHKRNLSLVGILCRLRPVYCQQHHACTVVLTLHLCVTGV